MSAPPRPNRQHVPEYALRSAEACALFRVSYKTLIRWEQAGRVSSVRTPTGQRQRDAHARRRMEEAVTRRMYRFVVPVDDAAHEFALTCNPVAVAATGDGRSVEFWAESYSDDHGIKRSFRVFGTGHPIPEGARYVGTCPRTAAGLVWHLYEVTP